jgi:crotonobetainyl-CoA:carnitine CoA-transferase CaiB-like acyl-CoA transferase
VLATLDHPLVPKYFDRFEENDTLYLVMEKIEGETLDRIRQREGALSETEVRRFLACAALEQKFWVTFCDLIRLPAELREDGYDPLATKDAIATIIRAGSGESWRQRLAGADCCVTIVATLEEALADPHFRARGLAARFVLLPDGTTLAATEMPIAPRFRDGEATKAAPDIDG